MAAFGLVRSDAGVESYPFTYPDRNALLADGWSFSGRSPGGDLRDTGAVSPGLVSFDQAVHPGVVRVLVDEGDLWSSLNDTRNSLFRQLPQNWTRVTATLHFAPTQNYQQAGLVVYQDDDNYVQVMRTHENGQHISMVQELRGAPFVVREEDVSAVSGIRLRLERQAPFSPIQGSYSLNGTDWVPLGETPMRVRNPLLGLVTGASPGGYPAADFVSVEVVSADVAWPEETALGELVASPSALTFSGTAGVPSDTVQKVRVFSPYDVPFTWQVTASEAWLQADETSGADAAEISISVNPAGLSDGIYTGTLTVTHSVSAVAPLTVAVTLVVNPQSPVGLATWKDGHRGAFSVSTDDGQPSGFDELVASGLTGTFVMNGTTPPPLYPAMYDAGMELGAHTVSHYCYEVDEFLLRDELFLNVAGLGSIMDDPFMEVITLIWPCGFNTWTGRAVASEYFLCARGYNINELEDPTPSDFMNIRSFNSHEHPPYPPEDLKSIVDAAEQEGKWANLVLHDYTNDDGAIAYSKSRDVWVAPIGTIVKYIVQRDRTVIGGVSDTGSEISFTFHRLPVAPSVLREFEPAILPTDTVTLRADVTGRPHVNAVTINGSPVAWNIRQEGVTTALYFSTPVLTTTQTATITFSDEAPPALAVSPEAFQFAAGESGSPESGVLSISNVGEGALEWTVAVSESAAPWLSVSPASGTGPAGVTVSVQAEGIPAGDYEGHILVTATGALNSPRVIPVSLHVSVPGVAHFNMAYPDRSALLADGWDFLARTAANTVRNTEQTSGAVVSYNSSGRLLIPADTGDLWEGINNTRNSLFRDLPPDWTSVTVKLDFAPWQYTQQAGIVIYQNDDNYVHVTRVYNGGQRIVAAVETGGAAELFGSEEVGLTAGIHLRLERNPATSAISASWSADGLDWTTLGTVTRNFASPRVGIIVCASPDGFPNAGIHWVQVASESGSSAPGPYLAVSSPQLEFTAVQGGSAPASQSLELSGIGDAPLSWTANPDAAWLQVSPASGTGNGTVSVSASPSGLTAGTYTGSVAVAAPGSVNGPVTVPVTLHVLPAGTDVYAMSYPDRAALLADGWDFLARTAVGAIRNTEQLNGAVVSFHPSGFLTIPADEGDLWENMNSTRNSLFRDLTADWTSVSVKLDFAPWQNTQQAGIVVYQDDDNYVQVTRIYAGGQKVVAAVETNGNAALFGTADVALTGGIHLQLDRNPATGEITASWSPDGVSWTPVGTITRTLNSPRLGIIVCASPDGFPEAAVHWVRVRSETVTPAPEFAVNESSLTFTAVENGSAAPSGSTIHVSGLDGSGLTWSASTGASWLQVSPASGSGDGSFTISVNPAGLSAGSYTGSVDVSVPGSANGSVPVAVSLSVLPQGAALHRLQFADRSAFLADGWDFLARTASGSNRNTEQTTGAVVTFDPAGGIHIPADTGDLWENLNDTRNSLFRDLPSAWTRVSTRIRFAPVANFQQAGLVVYQDDDNYFQITHVFNGNRRIVSVSEQNGTGALTGSVAADEVTDVHLSLQRDPAGGTISASYSLDGVLWHPLGTSTQTLNAPRLGLIVGASEGGFPVATVDWVSVETGATPVISLSEPALEFVYGQGGTVPPAWPVTVSDVLGGTLTWSASVSSIPWLSVSPATGSAGQALTVSVNPAGLATGEYDGEVTVSAPGAANSPVVLPVRLVVLPEGVVRYYAVYPDRTALLQDGWDFLARTQGGAVRDTEYTAGGSLLYDPTGTLRIPADAGDLWENLNNTRNTLFRDLPQNWTAIEARLSFAPQVDTQQAGIAVYDNDDSYVQVTRVHANGQKIVSVNEVNGSATLFGNETVTATTGFHLRLTRDPDSNAISAAWSLDGSAWADLGSVTRTFSAPRLAFIVCASPSGYPEAALEWIQVTTQP